MMTSHALPEVLQADTFDIWLAQLQRQEPGMAGNQLYPVLKQLYHGKAPAPTLAPLLDKLAPHVARIASGLEPYFLRAETAKTRKAAKLSIRLLRYIVLLYQQLLTQAREPDAIGAEALQRAVLLSFLAFKHSALIYERPSQSLWQVCCECYQIAEKHDWLERVQSFTLAGAPDLDTLIKAIKALILFQLVNPYQFSPVLIAAWAALCGRHAERLCIMPYTGFKTLDAHFVWSYQAKLPPQRIQPEQNLKFALLISANEFAEWLGSQDFKTSLDAADWGSTALAVIINVLTGYQSMGQFDSLLTSPNLYQLAAGLEHAIALVEKYEVRLKIMRLGATGQSRPGASPVLALKPLDEDQPNLGLTPEQMKVLGGGIGMVKINRTPQLNFCVAHTERVMGNIGDPAVLFDSQQAPVAGLIRRIQRQAQKETCRILIEQFRGASISVVTLRLPGLIERKGLLLTHPDKSQTLLLVTDKYSTGMVLDMQIGHETLRVGLQRLLEVTPQVMHYQVALQSEVAMEAEE